MTQQHSIKAAIRKYEASHNGQRLWLRRYQADPSARLVNARPPSTNHPQKMSYGWQQTICDAVRLCLARSQRVIASRIKAKTHFPASTKTVLKILKQNGLWKTRHTRKVQKRNLRHVNDMLRFCEKIQVDIKFLTDIPELKLTMKRAGLPKYQITARDCATGALWIGYWKG